MLDRIIIYDKFYLLFLLQNNLIEGPFGRIISEKSSVGMCDENKRDILIDVFLYKESRWRETNESNGNVLCSK